MSKPTVKSIIIEGVTQDGRKFRPSDWAERMSGMLSTFGRDHRIHYSPRLRPISVKGVKCIAITPDLAQTNPDVFALVMDFAKRNNLNIVEQLEEETNNA
ncbi:MAG: DUF3579 domain-containing protein [Gammaproteobacteria bacterium]|nr:DUF3579 domain-containing protein [Gammaproteobacteria bacterium]